MKPRWITLILVSTVMMMGYVFWDIASPISTTLKAPIEEGGMAWTSVEYGFYAGSYSIFNIFMLMLFFGGVILDYMGIRFTGILATSMMLLGAAVNYYALMAISPESQVHIGFTLFGLIPGQMKLQVLIAAIGFGLFGVGCDITGITVSKIVTKWFTGHELASAMGLQVAMARLGTASAISFSPLIANSFGISASVLAGVVLLLIGFMLFLVYVFMDKKRDEAVLSKHDTALDLEYRGTDSNDGDRQAPVVQKTDTKEPNDDFSFRDFLFILRNPGFWLIAFLCVFFYSSMRPFMKFATDILINKYGVAETTAGWIVSILPYGTIVLTPLFGSIYDKIGRGATLMLIGSSIVTACHLFMSLPIASAPWMAAIIMLLHGVAFSIVPSALWPSVPKIVPLKQLGTAYSIIYYVQNIGLMVVPIYIGMLIDDSNASSNGCSLPMLSFTLLGVAAVIICLALIALDRKKDFGLERPNIKKSSK